MKFIIVGDIGVTKVCEIVDAKSIVARVQQVKDAKFGNFAVYRIAEEVDITVAYPDFFGGDDTGGCR
ncbi:hypothetical protein [Paenibacillus polymyxa]|uniref:hypothetical protein n=1 Tax=Paenibacillus polymyxa TaxID=1406 RepID=UPI002AB3BDCC|nr:hypothetical protein [Paenibacillus polymyxa]MDY8021156.1 hypothetical protein [Paenibacillus polymyxa]